MSNYLGIDWGATNIGVALAHGETRVALVYMTLPNDKALIERLRDIVISQDIGTIVIGVPQYVHQKPEKSAGEALGEVLAKRCGVTVAYHNEMFTTKAAQANLIERGDKAVSKRDDAEAARIILQEWLDTHTSR